MEVEGYAHTRRGQAPMESIKTQKTSYCPHWKCFWPIEKKTSWYWLSCGLQKSWAIKSTHRFVHQLWLDFYVRKSKCAPYRRGILFSMCSYSKMSWSWTVCRSHRCVHKICENVPPYLAAMLILWLPHGNLGAVRSENSAIYVSRLQTVWKLSVIENRNLDAVRTCSFLRYSEKCLK